MSTVESETDSFEKKVHEHFDGLKNFESTVLKFTQLREGVSQHSLGLIYRIPLEFALLFAEIARWGLDRKHAVFENKALSILRRPEVRDRLCTLFNDNLDEPKSEAYIIKTIIHSLSDPAITESFSIPLDPELFAHFANEIMKTGVNVYCGTEL